MVIVKEQDHTRMMVVGPWTKAGVASYEEGAEIVWVKFSLGTFMPHLPARRFLDSETLMPEASGRSFWLSGSAWQFPDHNNVDTFIDRLVRSDVLVRDPLVPAVLQGRPQDMSPRTVRHRFLQATGLTQTHIRQVERARWAADLLREGMSIPDVAYEVGYYDQPHMTRSLKLWVGHTPAQLLRDAGP